MQPGFFEELIEEVKEEVTPEPEPEPEPKPKKPKKKKTFKLADLAKQKKEGAKKKK
jgi:hypothetical protein